MMSSGLSECVERESLRAWGRRPSAWCAVRGGALAASSAGLLVVVPLNGGEWRTAHAWRAEDITVLEPQLETSTLELSVDKTYIWRCDNPDDRRDIVRALAIGSRYNSSSETHPDLEEKQLAALLEDTAPPLEDTEQWARRLADTLAALDDSNLDAILDAERGTHKLMERLSSAARLGDAADEARAKLEAVGGGAGKALGPDGAPADRNARRLLVELSRVLSPLDVATDVRPDVGADEERLNKALEMAAALSKALKACEGGGGARWWCKLAAVRARKREVTRAADRLANAVARQLNDELLALAGGGGQEQRERVMALAPLAWWLRVNAPASCRALADTYARARARSCERQLRAVCDAARAACPTTTTPAAQHAANNPPLDAAIDEVLDTVEKLCDGEQTFCARTFFPDVEYTGDEEEMCTPLMADKMVGKMGPQLKALMANTFPTLEQELNTLLQHIDKHDPFGAMRLLSKVSARVLAGEGGGGGRHSAAVMAAMAVACKRAADNAVEGTLAEMHARPREAVEELRRWAAGAAEACRRAERERWARRLAEAALAAAGALPRAELRLAACHSLHGLLSDPSLRSETLAEVRREARSRYERELRALAAAGSRALEPLRSFLSTAAAAAGGGVRREEVVFVSACSKQALRRVLSRCADGAALRRSLWREYRGVKRALPADSGLLPVVWRAMQEDVIATHRALQERLSTYYAGAGLGMPFSTQDILDIFSEIAQQS